MFIEKKSKKVEYKVSRKYYVHVLGMNIKKTICVLVSMSKYDNKK